MPRPKKSASPFRYFNSSPEIIRLVVMMYVGFPLSLRNVEDLLFEPGIDVCQETVRLWWNRFGPMFAADIRRQRVSRMKGFRRWRWHLDEVFLKITGDAHVDVTRTYATNGLNQYTNVSGNTYCYDDNGNLTRDGQYAYLYDVENRLVEMRAMVSGACPTGSSGYIGQLKAQLRYDPAGRLYEVENFINGVAQGPTRFLYDGDALVAEYNANGTMLARYIHGPAAGADDPIAAYTGSGVAATDRTNLYADARGSIVLNTRHDGSNAQINTYDAYGVPGSTNTGRFQYTGQVWLAELGMNYYKARMYSPQLGRVMQTDPIGYEDNVNLYGYVGNDPINGVDPTGEKCQAVGKNVTCTMQFDKKISEMSEEELAEANSAIANYTMAAATAHVAALAGASATVEGFAGVESFQVPAAEIRDQLFDSEATYYFDAGGASFNMRNSETHGIQVNGETVKGWSDAKYQSTFIHEGIHHTPAERAAIAGRSWGESSMYWGHGDAYRQASSEFMRRNKGLTSGFVTRPQWRNHRNPWTLRHSVGPYWGR